MKKVTVITTLFIFFLCSTFSFCYATSNQALGNPQKEILISKEDKKETKEKIEKLEEKIKKLKEDKEKIEKEIQENEKELKKLIHKKKS
ncbi:MAG: hypothetical protein MUQ20_03240 [Deltaproteobacteria bacterium]|nr:hypothetical protein [Deltaproteobacteria bacterium]